MMPTPAPGLTVNEFAGGLAHPRWLHVLPNGDVLVAETDNPGTDKTGGSIKGAIQKMLMKKAGSGTGSANRISLLRDGDGDGVAEVKTPLLTGLYSPFGMVFANGELFVANADGVVAFPFQPGQTAISVKPRSVTRSRRAIITIGPSRWSPRLMASSCSSGSDRTAMSAKTAWKWRRAAPRSG